jgi:hypothetical protein
MFPAPADGLRSGEQSARASAEPDQLAGSTPAIFIMSR